ncbi:MULTISPECIES: hypothetical protein [Paenibacillus]|uniref:hypothetical protein n=1 Tax=Paenibacillus TaxID=44249 RepID=UPI00035D9F0E|nr:MULTISPECIES: hypothetical protein [Paenibacillus]
MTDNKHYDDVFWKTRNSLMDDEDSQPAGEDAEVELPRDAELAVIQPERMDPKEYESIADEEDAGMHPQADPEDIESDAALAREEDMDENK